MVAANKYHRVSQYLINTAIPDRQHRLSRFQTLIHIESIIPEERYKIQVKFRIHCNLIIKEPNWYSEASFKLTQILSKRQSKTNQMPRIVVEQLPRWLISTPFLGVTHSKT